MYRGSDTWVSLQIKIELINLYDNCPKDFIFREVIKFCSVLMDKTANIRKKAHLCIEVGLFNEERIRAHLNSFSNEYKKNINRYNLN